MTVRQEKSEQAARKGQGAPVFRSIGIQAVAAAAAIGKSADTAPRDAESKRPHWNHGARRAN